MDRPYLLSQPGDTLDVIARRVSDWTACFDNTGDPPAVKDRRHAQVWHEGFRRLNPTLRDNVKLPTHTRVWLPDSDAVLYASGQFGHTAPAPDAVMVRVANDGYRVAGRRYPDTAQAGAAALDARAKRRQICITVEPDAKSPNVLDLYWLLCHANAEPLFAPWSK